LVVGILKFCAALLIIFECEQNYFDDPAKLFSDPDEGYFQ